MKVTYLSFLIFLTISCHSQVEQNQILGQWLTQEVDSYIMDFDTNNLLNMYAYEIPVSMEFQLEYTKSNEFSMIPIVTNKGYGPIGTGSFIEQKNVIKSQKTLKQFEVKEDTLWITDVQGQTTKAVNCNTGICDFEKMYFKDLELSISLPVFNGKNIERYEPSPIDIDLYGGNHKIKEIPTFSGIRYFWFEQQPLDEIKLSLLISEFRTRNEKEARIILWIDKNTETNFVLQLLQLLYKNQISTAYFGIKQSPNVHTTFEPLLLPFSLKKIEIETETSKFKNWLNHLSK